MELTKDKTIGDYVAEDYRTAAVFKKHQIDFCCNGNRDVSEAAAKKKIDPEVIFRELEAVKTQSNTATDYAAWPLDLLADYVEKRHHRYIEEKTPVISGFLEKLCKVHGGHHPELFEINEIFKASTGDMAKHMKKEELILFPFIAKMVKTKLAGTELTPAHFGSVGNPVQMMMEDHNVEGECFRKIAELSSDYTMPSDGCNTYRVTFAMLKEYEEDLHLHIHLENNILFPKAIELEEELNS